MKTIKINITEADKKKYGCLKTKHELEVYSTLKNSSEISKPIEMPNIGTIKDLRVIPPETGIILKSLYATFPKVNFENLKPKEVEIIHQYTDAVKEMSRKEIWGTIKIYFPSVFNTELGDNLSKMNEVLKRSENDPNYVPTTDVLNLIARKITDGRTDLFKFNIDLDSPKFTYRDNPIEFLLVSMKIQKDFYPSRGRAISKAYYPKFKTLNRGHAELMIKLKLSNKSAGDFFGSSYTKVSTSLKILRNMMYRTLSGKPLTFKQQSTALNIIEAYKKTMDIIFAVSDGRDKVLFDADLKRPVHDVDVAALEIFYTFDDSTVGRTDSYPSTCKIINSIYMDVSFGRASKIYDNIIIMDNLKDFIKQYFTFNQIERDVIQNKTVDAFPDVQKSIIDEFFYILNKYVS